MNNKNLKKNKNGFTLIELIVVIAILAVLALILVPAIGNYVTEAEDSKNLTNVRAYVSEVSTESLINETVDDSGTDGAKCSDYVNPPSGFDEVSMVCQVKDGKILDSNTGAITSRFSFKATSGSKATYTLENGQIVETKGN